MTGRPEKDAVAPLMVALDREDAPAVLQPGPASTSAQPARRVRTRRRRTARPPRPLAPRDARWWTGLAMAAVSLLVAGSVLQIAVLSGLQHQRATVLGYDELRTTLAQGDAPIGQLDVDSDLVAAGTPVALLEIPAIGLREVVREGSDAAVLRSGPGHRRDTVMPGQAGTSVILGRQTCYGGPFGHLDALKLGDRLTVTTGQGVATYRVFSLRRSGDPQPVAIASGEGRLELETIDGAPLFPSGVLHIDAILTSRVQPAPAKVMTYAALPAADKAMGTDPSAWPLALVGIVGFLALLAALGWLLLRTGPRVAWLVAVPVLVAVGACCADLIVDALPNLL